jgi:hypothetical protein
MPDTTPVQVNLINPSFFYESHSTIFVEPNASQSYAVWILGSKPDVARISLTSLRILITDLEKGYQALRAIPAKIEQVGDSFVASFEEANIHASGETWSSAALNLKSLILDVYDSLTSETAALSRPAKRQLATLLRYVQKDNS